MGRNHSIDTLRTVAMLLVVLLHAASTYVVGHAAENSYDVSFWIANLTDSFCRVSVPVFVLISGRFLLGRNEPARAIYNKTLYRIFVPLLFWTAVYFLYMLAVARLEGWVIHETLLLRFARPFYHLWYLPMILGLYCLIPFLNYIIAVTRRAHSWFLACLFIVLGMLLPVYQLISGKEFSAFLEPLKYIGYFMLGYLLKDMRPVSSTILTLVYVFCSLLIAVLSFYTLRNFGTLYFYNYLSPLVVASSLSFYKIFSQASLSDNYFSAMARFSFGVYLIHAGILDLINRILKLQNLHFLDSSLSGIPIKFAFTLLFSILFTRMIYKVRPLRRLI